MKININFGEILTKAWQITWKFKVLWIFGILVGLSGGDRRSFNFNFNNSGTRWDFGNGNNPGLKQIPDWMRRFFTLRPEQALRAIWEQYAGIIVAVVLGMCLLWLVFYLLGIMGKIGLIWGAGQADAGAERLGFGEIWTQSLPHFWRIVGLSLLVGLPFFLVTVILLAAFGASAIGALQGQLSGSGLAAFLLGAGGLLIAALCIVGLASILVDLIVEQAQNAIVLENLGILEGLNRGWNIFRVHWAAIMLMGLIMWMVGVVLSLVIAIPLIIVFIPAAIAMGAAVAASKWLGLALIVGGCILLWLPVGLLLNGVLLTYFQAMWTLTFRRLTTLPAPEIPAPAENLAPQ